MIFYLVLGGLFCVYAVDLVFLVLMSIAARCTETPPGIAPDYSDQLQLYSDVSLGIVHVVDAVAANATADGIQERQTADGIPISATASEPSTCPKVLIQLPMFNEDAHCQMIVKHCCAINWPVDRMLIQVLDDSTKEEVRHKVDMAALNAMEHGHMVHILRRNNRYTDQFHSLATSGTTWVVDCLP